MDKRTPITTSPYQVPSVDVTPDPPIFSLVTTFKMFSLKSVGFSSVTSEIHLASFKHVDCGGFNVCDLAVLYIT